MEKEEKSGSSHQNPEDQSLGGEIAEVAKEIELKPEIPSNSKDPRVIMELLSSQFSGPIPHPTILKAYNSIEPGLAREIIDMAKRQSQHRIKMEEIVIVGDNNRAWAGLILGFVITCLCIGSSTFLIAKGHDVAGGAVGVGAIGSLVGTFIYGTNQRIQEREQQRKDLLERSSKEEEQEQ